jgi:uncharacterized protein YegP (UPF0339 family)
MTPLSLDSLNPAKIEVYRRAGDESDRFDWRLIAGNGEVVCSSLQGFNSRGDATKAAERAIDLMGQAPEMRQV